MAATPTMMGVLSLLEPLPVLCAAVVTTELVVATMGGAGLNDARREGQSTVSHSLQASCCVVSKVMLPRLGVRGRARRKSETIV